MGHPSARGGASSFAAMRTGLIRSLAAVAPVALLVTLAYAPAPASADLGACSAADVGGTVFRDYNADGVQDFAEPGFGDQFAPDTVTVTAFGSGNTVVGGPTSPDADGDYVFGPVVGPVRIEVSGVPDYLEPGAYDPGAVGSLTTVLFADPGDCSVDIGLNNPNDFCSEAGAALGVTCLDYGDHADNTDSPGFVLLDEDVAGNGANVYPPGTTIDKLGAVYGVAYQRTTGNWYLGAYSKRHVDYGPTGDPGTIYEVDAVGATPLINLPAGPNLHGPLPDTAAVTDRGSYFYDLQPGWPAADPAGDPTWDEGMFDAVGASGLGDIELDPTDDSTLYVVNLFDRSLYRVDVTDGTQIGAAQAIPNPGCAGGPADWRPFALGWTDGSLYVGGVCSGQTRSLQDDLSAAIYAYDPVAATFGGAPVFSLDAGDFAYNGCPQVANCGNRDRDLITPGNYPWANDFGEFEIQYPNLQSTEPTIARNQPMLTDIEFDNGDLLLGFRDRGADQVGLNSGGTDPTDAKLYTVWGGAGDLWRACHDGAGGWVLENAGSCGGKTPASPLGPIGTANGTPENAIPEGVPYGTANNQGPGGGEYYWDDLLAWTPADWPYTRATERHSEITFGGLVQIPGRSWVATNAFDLFRTWEGGLAFYNHEDGSSRRYRIFGRTALGKAQGLGDIEAACSFAPVEIGNRVWIDLDGNGIQDPDEAPAPGITVRLYDSTGMVVATAVTNAAGEFVFVEDDAPNLSGTPEQGVVVDGFVSGEAYVIRLDNPADYDIGGPLEHLRPTLPNYGGNSYEGDDVNGTGLTHDIHDSDGVLGDVLGLGAEYPETAVVHLADTDGDGVGDTIEPGVGPAGDNDHTFDFGFTTFSLGNVVFWDQDHDGVRGAGEAGIEGVWVELWRDADGDGVPDDVDGDGNVAEDPDDMVAMTTTDADGMYLFDGLAPGGYLVSIPSAEWVPAGSLEGWVSSTGSSAADDDVDEVDDGIDPAVPGETVWSSTVTLDGGSEPLDEDPDNDVVTPDGNENLTVDFGFWQPAGIGDFVWYDANRNGEQDAGEPPVSGVTVSLIDSATGAVLETTITDTSGYYVFAGLVPGDYQIRFDLTTLPAATVVTAQDSGDDALDSDADPATGLTVSTTLEPGEFDPTWDLGIYEPVVDLMIEKMAVAATSEIDGAVEWTLVVTNLGPDADPGPLTVVDELPPSLEYVAADGAGWECTHSEAVVECVWDGRLDPSNSTEPITVETVLVGARAGDSVVNTASAFGALAETSMSNNEDSAAVEVLAQPVEEPGPGEEPGDPTPAAPSPEEALPVTGAALLATLRFGALLLGVGLVLVLIAVGYIRMRRGSSEGPLT